MSDILEKCERIMSLAPKKMVDGFAKKQLSKSLGKYQSSSNTKIADIYYKIGNDKHSTILDSIYVLKEWNDIEIHFFHPNTQERWEYDTPTQHIKINWHGKGGLVLFQIDPRALEQWDPSQEPIIEPAMFRCYLSHFYSPESIKAYTKKHDEKPLRPPRELCTPFELWEDIRKKGIVPFQITLCAYTKNKRYVYQLNVIDNALLKDFRDGKIPIANRIFREPLDYYHLDKMLSTQELPDLAKKVLEVFFDLDEANISDIEIGLGITEKMAQNNIEALVKRDLLETIGKPPKAKYRINLENIKKITGEPE
ncbi:MAG: hypothetical protein JSV09_07380 [Thermoplasmata archaeon]|nr:MAG: hypothetical protein JSV09_07380 [Thermoplasmata archaeon]